MKTIVSVFLYVIICSIQIYAVSAEEINLNAKAAVIMDAESGKILYEDNSFTVCLKKLQFFTRIFCMKCRHYIWKNILRRYG